MEGVPVIPATTPSAMVVYRRYQPNPNKDNARRSNSTKAKKTSLNGPVYNAIFGHEPILIRGLPLRLDTYRGCAFRCSYCFARYRGGNLPGQAVRAADAQQINTVFDRALNRASAGVIAEFLPHRTPIHLGGMSDPLQPAEERHKVTASVLKTLIRYQYPLVLNTRSALTAKLPYIDLLKDLKSAVVQFSFSSTVASTAARVEPAIAL